MTSHIVRTALSTHDHPLVPMRPLPPSAMSTSPGYEEPITWAASYTNTGWSPDLGGRGSQHSQVNRPTASMGTTTTKTHNHGARRDRNTRSDDGPRTGAAGCYW